jgi:hypothetical protein
LPSGSNDLHHENFATQYGKYRILNHHNYQIPLNIETNPRASIKFVHIIQQLQEHLADAAGVARQLDATCRKRIPRALCGCLAARKLSDANLASPMVRNLPFPRGWVMPKHSVTSKTQSASAKTTRAFIRLR